MSIAPPVFPPLLRGVRVGATSGGRGDNGGDPFEAAISAAGAGIEAGTIFWADRDDLMDVALVLAPETTLALALAMVPTAMVGVGDSIGALAPPEVSVTWCWPDRIRVNGADCGVVRAAASTSDPAAIPDWLVVAVTVQRAPLGGEPGARAHLTSLVDEGCSTIDLTRMIESWARHTLVWINRWEDEGFAPIHDSWCGRAEGIGKPLELRHDGKLRSGVFLGLDEHARLLLKTDDETLALPLASMLQAPSPWPPEDINP